MFQAAEWSNGQLLCMHMGVSKNNGTPKWMVKIRETLLKWDDLGIPLFLETSIWWCQSWNAESPPEHCFGWLPCLWVLSHGACFLFTRYFERTTNGLLRGLCGIYFGKKSWTVLRAEKRHPPLASAHLWRFDPSIPFQWWSIQGPCSWNFFFRSSFPVAPRVAVVTLLTVVVS